MNTTSIETCNVKLCFYSTSELSENMPRRLRITENICYVIVILLLLRFRSFFLRVHGGLLSFLFSVCFFFVCMKPYLLCHQPFVNLHRSLLHEPVSPPSLALRVIQPPCVSVSSLLGALSRVLPCLTVLSAD